MIGLVHPLEFEPRLRLIICDEFNIMANTTLSEGKSGIRAEFCFCQLRLEAGYLNQYLEDLKTFGQQYRASFNHSIVICYFFNI